MVVAGIGGLLTGHMLWLVLISMATRSSSASSWVLVISALVVIGAVLAGRRARQHYERQELGWAAFLGTLPVSPVIFTLIVLGETYL